MVGCWQLGNTTVRSALRIREGLIAYGESDIQGAIRGRDGDIAFRNLLGGAGLVSLGADETYSAGRKWRSAMGKLGFIYPEVKRDWGFSQDDLGPLDYITPAGRALIQATTMPAIYESYLRSMAVPLERLDDGGLFSPLRWVLAVLLTLEEESSDEAFLSFVELAAFVQTSNPSQDRKEVMHQILAFRTQRAAAASAKMFERGFLESIGMASGYKADTLRDYADENIRYLKATGLFEAKGRGIRLAEEKRYVARALSDAYVDDELSLLHLYRELCRGADLPTDAVVVARAAVQDLSETLQSMGLRYSLEGVRLDTAAQVNRVRYEMEELVAREKECVYASRQRLACEEIAAYLELLETGKKKKVLSDGAEVRLSKEERPAFFEWAVWRSLLAADNLQNAPYEVRRFKVDSDFKPVCTAPGNGPDLVAEYEDFVLAVEVTMSTGSRQEAMEGEPVRRHIADLMVEYSKPVLGLFVAVRVNLNTIETFRHGIWYTPDEQEIDLGIVPLELSQYRALFACISKDATVLPSVPDLFQQCLSGKGAQDAKEWRGSIGRLFPHVET